MTLSTFVSGGANWGSITGLAPAAIDYKYASTGGVNITTGSGGDTVNVLATGVADQPSTSGGVDTVNVGNAGSVQGILGALTVQNPPSFDTLNVNDSADTTARTVTLSTFASGGTNWGSITGLAPAAINYNYTDTSSVNITTGSGNDTVNVLATGVGDQPEHQRRARHGQRGQRRQRPGHPRRPDHPEPAELRHDQRQRLGRHRRRGPRR